MKRQSAAASAVAEEQEGIQKTLAVIEEQGRQTLELVKAIIGLLLPKEGREGPSFEELLAKLVAQQHEALVLAKATQADVARLPETLPPAIAEAIEHRIGFAGAPRS